MTRLVPEVEAISRLEEARKAPPLDRSQTEDLCVACGSKLDESYWDCVCEACKHGAWPAAW